MSRFNPEPSAPPAPSSSPYPTPSAPPISTGDPTTYSRAAAGGAGAMGLFHAAARPPITTAGDPKAPTKSGVTIAKSIPLDILRAAHEANTLTELAIALKSRLASTSGTVNVWLGLTRRSFRLIVEYPTKAHAALLQECFMSYFASRRANQVSSSAPAYFMAGDKDGFCWGIRPAVAHVDYWFDVTGDGCLKDKEAASLAAICASKLGLKLTEGPAAPLIVLADIGDSERIKVIPPTSVSLKQAWDCVEAFSSGAALRAATHGNIFSRTVMECAAGTTAAVEREGAFAFSSTSTTTIGLG